MSWWKVARPDPKITGSFADQRTEAEAAAATRAFLEVDLLIREQERDEHGRYGAGSGNPMVAKALREVPEGVTTIDKVVTGTNDVAQWTADAGAFGAEYRTAVVDWSSSAGNAEGIRAALNGDAVEPTKGTHADAGGFGRTEDQLRSSAATFDRALKDAPSMEQSIFRGVAVTGTPDFTKGDTVKMGLSSFSRDPLIAQVFAGNATVGSRERTGVIFNVEPGAKGLPLDGLSMFPKEREVISGGRFEVLSVMPGVSEHEYWQVHVRQLS